MIVDTKKPKHFGRCPYVFSVRAEDCRWCAAYRKDHPDPHSIAEKD